MSRPIAPTQRRRIPPASTRLLHFLVDGGEGRVRRAAALLLPPIVVEITVVHVVHGEGAPALHHARVQPAARQQLVVRATLLWRNEANQKVSEMELLAGDTPQVGYPAERVDTPNQPRHLPS
jgi:hypothetical protein